MFLFLSLHLLLIFLHQRHSNEVLEDHKKFFFSRSTRQWRWPPPLDLPQLITVAAGIERWKRVVCAARPKNLSVVEGWSRGKTGGSAARWTLRREIVPCARGLPRDTSASLQRRRLLRWLPFLITSTKMSSTDVRCVEKQSKAKQKAYKISSLAVEWKSKKPYRDRMKTIFV